MKPFEQANPRLLQQMFQWKKAQGEWIRFEMVEDPPGKWIVHFFSEDHITRDRHIFASFSGKDPDEMKRWALMQLARFNMGETI